MLNLEAPDGSTWEFLVLFLVVLVGPIVVERFRMPGIIGLLIGGFIIGPQGLGAISSGNTTVPDLGQLGLLYLMFVAGVELDLSMIRMHRRGVIIFAGLTFAVPMVFGSAVGFALGWSTPAALLLGSLLASHTLLTYPIIRRAGLSANPAAATAVGATVITDTLALLVLAAVSGTQTGSGTTLEIMIQLAIGLVVLTLSTLWLMPKLARVTLTRFGTEKPVRYLIAICAFLLAATISEVFGIEGIVGAFFAGLALNRLVPNGGPLMDRVEFFGSAVFIPVFMVSVGLILNPGVMAEPSTLGLAGLMIVACLGGKAIAAYLTVPLLGFSRSEGSMIFSMTSPQAAATLAAVMVGLQIGLFGESVVNASLVVILVSVILSTLVAERSVKGVEPLAVEHRPLGSHILVAVENPQQAASAMRVAAWIAGPEGGTATVLTVGDPRKPGLPGELRDRLERDSVAAGLDAHLAVVHDTSFARGVLNAAASSSASLILAMIKDQPARAARGWAEAVAGASPMPTALLRGETDSLTSVLVQPGEDCPAASELAATIGSRIGEQLGETGVSERSDRMPGSGPATGQILIRPVQSWDFLAGLPDVPEGAAMIVIPDFVSTAEEAEKQAELAVAETPLTGN